MNFVIHRQDFSHHIKFCGFGSFRTNLVSAIDGHLVPNKPWVVGVP